MERMRTGRTTWRNRKTAEKLLLVQWSRFQNVCIHLEGSTLFTGINGSGKSTILDAMTYLLTGNTQFNKAAKDRDRTVAAYVRGDTKSNGSARFLRTGEVVSYLAMEFWDPLDMDSLVVGVCIESADETSAKGNWFICRGTKLEQMNFTKIEGKILRITPKNELAVDGQRLRSADFFGRDKGVEQVLRALGLRCEAGKYRSKLLKMMAFNPENNIDQFIQECVLEPGKIDSLKELREQRENFERIKDIYENLKRSRAQLEKIETISAEYEAKQKNLQIRELMFAYQQLREKREKKKETEFQLEQVLLKKGRLDKRIKELEEQYRTADERYQAAQNNDVYRGMKESIGALENQVKDLHREIREGEEKLAKVKRLQRQMEDLLSWTGELFSVSEEDRRYLCHLSEKGYNEEKKTEAFLRLSRHIQNQDKLFEEEEVHCSDEIKQRKQELEELETKIKRLQANQLVFPKHVEKAKALIREELAKQGIDTEVRIFAELIQEVKEEEWRGAIETFLGRKRYDVIVEGKYCHQAMELLKQKSIHGIHVVITDKLPETPIAQGSAAQLLTIPNVFARRYANFLLNGIHRCASMEELHEHPKGGLMSNGMLAKSYAVSNMDLEQTEFCLGGDAVKHQLNRALEEKKEIQEALRQSQLQKEKIRKKRGEIKDIDWKAENYEFRADQLLADHQAEREKLQAKIAEMENSADFLAILQEVEDAKQARSKVEEENRRCTKELGRCESDREQAEALCRTLSGEIFTAKKEYEEKCIDHLELVHPMEEEYERLRAKKENGSWQVITAKSVNNLAKEVNQWVTQLENEQLEYCKLAEIDSNKRGAAYIPFFREEYRSIANIKIEEAHQRLEEQAKKLESAFMNDFVAEINETIREAKREIESINRELKQLPFGKDTYRFVMEEKADRAVFFRICKKLESYMDSPEVYMNSFRDDEEMENDIREFMSVILEEEDEKQYTDYRKYFQYDMKIISRQGENEVVADLSKKQGSASNGEKQTPYFIILAASLIQCYPKQSCCARLAFIDEAFSALSRERIEQMVKYFEENHFQVFYAAPPEKINSIGAFIQSTVSLVMAGRYTHAVEGLVKAEYETETV